MRIVVTGDRNWNDTNIIEQAFGIFISGKNVEIIHGNCIGCDLLAKEVALKSNYRVRDFPADWANYGRSAGPIRNKQMLAEKPNFVLAFHDNIGESKGTKDCINQAKKLKITVYLFNSAGSYITM